MRLKEVRNQRNKTQVEIANYLNINQEKYSRIESEKSKIDIELLIQLADLYKITIDELVGHKVPYLIDKSLLSKNQLELIDIIRTMSDEECRFLTAYAMGIKKGIEERNAKFGK